MACNLIDTKEFKIQIKELLQNNLIRPSLSPHKSSDHIQEKKGKTKDGY